MAIPDYQSTFLPLLQCIGDEQQHQVCDLISELADHFRLTNEERNALLPSGTQRIFDNRVGWARTYLKKAHLLDSPGRGVVQITTRGLDVLRQNLQRLDNRFLRTFPEFVEFQRGSTVESGSTESTAGIMAPPTEAIESGYQSIRRSLSLDLLERLKTCDPRYFEKVVVDLLVSMGYGGSQRDAGQVVGQSGDGGIDGVIKEDKLGLDIVYVQAKRWDSTVGRPVVQAFAGSLEGRRAKKGVLITTSRFSDDAKEYVRQIEKRIVLIDGDELAQLMIEHGVGVSDVATYVIKKIDLDYFEAEE